MKFEKHDLIWVFGFGISILMFVWSFYLPPEEQFMVSSVHSFVTMMCALITFLVVLILKGRLGDKR